MIYIFINNKLMFYIIEKDSDAGKDGWQKKGVAEDEMVGWHHQLSGRH